MSARQSRRHFVNDLWKIHFLLQWKSSYFWSKCHWLFPWGSSWQYTSIGSISKTVHEPIMTQFTDAYTRHQGTMRSKQYISRITSELCRRLQHYLWRSLTFERFMCTQTWTRTIAITFTGKTSRWWKTVGVVNDPTTFLVPMTKYK